MAEDAFEAHRPGLTSPIDRLAAVTKSDTADLPGGLSRALYVGTGGSLIVTDRHGTTATFANVPDGAMLPIRVARVLATGTTAADIVALY